MKYPEDYINQIIQGDSLAILKTLSDKSIDMLFTDPPYNVSRKNNFGTMKRYNSYKGMDFGEWDWNFNQTDWIKIVASKLKDNCNVVIFNSWQNLKLINDCLTELSFEVKRPIVLKKNNPMPANRDRLFLNSFEFGIWATKGKWTFNRINKYNEAFFEVSNNGKTTHPTEKNIDAIKYFITILSNKNDLILDPFLGSGTTAVACKELGRRYIGIEINQEYINMANKRLKKISEVLF